MAASHLNNRNGGMLLTRNERSMPKWVTEQSDRIGPKPPPPPVSSLNGDISPKQPNLPPKTKTVPEPDYEVIEFSNQQYSNAPLRPNSASSGSKTPDNKLKCTLCGSGNPWVTCDECSQQIFCASCDDMFHKHPKRKNHQRKTIDKSLPPLPPKTLPGQTGPTPPVAPPRRNKRGLMTPLMQRKDQGNSMPAPFPVPPSPTPSLKNASWQERFGSMSRGLNLLNRPLPDTPKTPPSESSRSTTPKSVFDNIQRPPSVALEKIKSKANATLDRMQLLQQRYRQQKEQMERERSGSVTDQNMSAFDQWSSISQSPSHFRSGSMSSGINSSHIDLMDDNSFNLFHQRQLALQHHQMAAQRANQLGQRALSTSVFNLNQINRKQPPTSNGWMSSPMQQAQSMAQLNCMNCAQQQQSHWNGHSHIHPNQDPWSSQLTSHQHLNRSNMSLNVPSGYMMQPHMNGMYPPPTFMNQRGLMQQMYPQPYMGGMPVMNPGLVGMPPSTSRAASRAGSRLASPAMSRKSVTLRRKQRSNYVDDEATDDEDSDEDDRRSIASNRSAVSRSRQRRLSSVSQMQFDDDIETPHAKQHRSRARNQRRDSIAKSVHNDWAPGRRGSITNNHRSADSGFNSPLKPSRIYSDLDSEGSGTRALVQAKIEQKLKEESLKQKQTKTKRQSQSPIPQKTSAAVQTPAVKQTVKPHENFVKVVTKETEQEVRNSSEIEAKEERKTKETQEDKQVSVSEEEEEEEEEEGEGEEEEETESEEEDEGEEMTSKPQSPEPNQEEEAEAVEDDLGPPPSTPDHEWECEFCTFVNEANIKICSICCKTPSIKPKKAVKSVSPPKQIRTISTETKEKAKERDKPKNVQQVQDKSGTIKKRPTTTTTTTNNKQSSALSQTKTSTSESTKSINHVQATKPDSAHNAVDAKDDSSSNPLKKKETVEDIWATLDENIQATAHEVTRKAETKKSSKVSTDCDSSSKSKSVSVEPPENDSSKFQAREIGTSPPPQSISTQTYETLNVGKIEAKEDTALKSQTSQPLFSDVIQESDLYKYTTEELNAALKYCGPDMHPLVWLRDNWPKLIQTVQSLATKYGQERAENTIGTISQMEAREALRLHTGNIWQAVSECIEQRQRKYREIFSKGNFSREDIVTALTTHQGNIELALHDLGRNQLKPFLMRIWGSPGGVENESGSQLVQSSQSTHLNIDRDIHNFLSANASDCMQTPNESGAFHNNNNQMPSPFDRPVSFNSPFDNSNHMLDNASIYSADSKDFATSPLPIDESILSNKNILKDLETLIGNMEHNQQKQNEHVLRSIHDMINNMSPKTENEYDSEAMRILTKSPIIPNKYKTVPKENGLENDEADVKNFVWQHIQEIVPNLVQQVEIELMEDIEETLKAKEQNDNDKRETTAESTKPITAPPPPPPPPIDQDEFLMEEVIKPNIKNASIRENLPPQYRYAAEIATFQMAFDKGLQKEHEEEFEFDSFEEAQRFAYKLFKAPSLQQIETPIQAVTSTIDSEKVQVVMQNDLQVIESAAHQTITTETETNSSEIPAAIPDLENEMSSITQTIETATKAEGEHLEENISETNNLTLSDSHQVQAEEQTNNPSNQTNSESEETPSNQTEAVDEVTAISTIETLSNDHASKVMNVVNETLDSQNTETQKDSENKIKNIIQYEQTTPENIPKVLAQDDAETLTTSTSSVVEYSGDSGATNSSSSTLVAVPEDETSKVVPVTEETTQDKISSKEITQSPTQPKAQVIDDAPNQSIIENKSPLVAVPEDENSKVVPVTEETTQDKISSKEITQSPTQPKAQVIDDAPNQSIIENKSPLVAVPEDETSKVVPVTEETTQDKISSKEITQSPTQPKAQVIDDAPNQSIIENKSPATQVLYTNKESKIPRIAKSTSFVQKKISKIPVRRTASNKSLISSPIVPTTTESKSEITTPQPNSVNTSGNLVESPQPSKETQNVNDNITDDESDEELYSIASGSSTTELASRADQFQSPVSTNEVILMIQQEESENTSTIAPSTSSSTLHSTISQSSGLKSPPEFVPSSDPSKQNLSELVEDTQRLIKQMRDEISIDDFESSTDDDEYTDEYSDEYDDGEEEELEDEDWEEEEDEVDEDSQEDDDDEYDDITEDITEENEILNSEVETKSNTHSPLLHSQNSPEHQDVRNSSVLSNITTTAFDHSQTLPFSSDHFIQEDAQTESISVEESAAIVNIETNLAELPVEHVIDTVLEKLQTPVDFIESENRLSEMPVETKETTIESTEEEQAHKEHDSEDTTALVSGLKNILSTSLSIDHSIETENSLPELPVEVVIPETIALDIKNVDQEINRDDSNVNDNADTSTSKSNSKLDEASAESDANNATSQLQQVKQEDATTSLDIKTIKNNVQNTGTVATTNQQIENEMPSTSQQQVKKTLLENKIKEESKQTKNTIKPSTSRDAKTLDTKKKPNENAKSTTKKPLAASKIPKPKEVSRDQKPKETNQLAKPQNELKNKLYTRSKSFSGPTTPIGIASVKTISQKFISPPQNVNQSNQTNKKQPTVTRKPSIIEVINKFTKPSNESDKPTTSSLLFKSRTQPRIPKKKYHETCFSDDDYETTSSEEELEPLEVRQRKLSVPVFRTYPSVRQEPEEVNTTALIEKFMNEELTSTIAEAQIAAALVAMKFQEDVSIWAAKECSDIDHAIALLKQECELCSGTYALNQIVSMLKCTHKCCKQCAKTYFTVQITERSINDCSCPFCKLPELHNQTEHEDENLEYFSNLDIFLKNILEPEVHELFQRKLRDRTLLKDPNFKWCVQCSSGFFARPKQKRLICPDCGSVTCAQCRKPWQKQHEGISCDQFSEWESANDPEVQAKGVQRHLEQNGIDCPKCKFKYSLARGGCMHFTCTQCKYEFCYGCAKPFMMGAKCTISPYCAKLGLHAHHPRNCLFYLRDKLPVQLQILLKNNGVTYEVDPIELPDDSNKDDDGPSSSKKKDLLCPIPIQKETPTGLVDTRCNGDVPDKHAGMCRTHYVEYLTAKVAKAKIDPLPIFDLTDCVQELRRRGIPLPERGPWDTDEIYKNMCTEVIQKNIPLDAV